MISSYSSGLLLKYLLDRKGKGPWRISAMMHKALNVADNIMLIANIL